MDDYQSDSLFSHFKQLKQGGSFGGVHCVILFNTHGLGLGHTRVMTKTAGKVAEDVTTSCCDLNNSCTEKSQSVTQQHIGNILLCQK